LWTLHDGTCVLRGHDLVNTRPNQPSFAKEEAMTLQTERVPSGTGAQQPKRPAKNTLVLVSVLIAAVVAIVAGVGLGISANGPSPSDGTTYQAPRGDDRMDAPAGVPNANEREGRVDAPVKVPNANEREGRVDAPVKVPNANEREGRVGH
jgi:hypothetical protein